MGTALFCLFILSALLLSLTLPAYTDTEGVGYLEVRLKSAFPLNVTIEVAEGIYFPTNKQVFEMRLLPDKVGTLTSVPVTFHRPGVVLIRTGPVEKFGLDYETIRSERWNTQKMTISPPKIHLPFTGFRLEIKCENYWHGLGCGRFCNENIAKLLKKRCNSHGKLGCQPGFQQMNCKLPLLNSDTKCQCKNNGTCVSSFIPYPTKESFICECENGFEGEKCEKKGFNYLVPVVVKMHGRDRKWNLLKHFFINSLVPNELA